MGLVPQHDGEEGPIALMWHTIEKARIQCEGMWCGVMDGQRFPVVGNH